MDVPRDGRILEKELQLAEIQEDLAGGVTDSGRKPGLPGTASCPGEELPLTDLHTPLTLEKGSIQVVAGDLN